MTRISIKYFLLLSFFLAACLPDHRTQKQSSTAAKAFVAVVDHVASLAATDKLQKLSDKESEKFHLVNVNALSLPSAQRDRVQHTSFSIITTASTYYPIRAPPNQA